MTRRHLNVAAALAGPFILGAAEVSAQTVPAPRPSAPSNTAVPVSIQANAQHGRIGGKVTDDQGRAIEGALVTALGTSVQQLAVSDASGQYSMTLPPGEYHLVVHRDGYSSRFREWVRVAAYGSITRPITMQRAVMTAGLGGRSIIPIASDPKAHPHGEQAWRMRHVKRTALRDTNPLRGDPGDLDDVDDGPAGWFGRAVWAPARFASALFTDLPIDGEFRVLTAGSVGPYASFFSDLGAAGVAYLSVRAPVGSHGEWAMRGTMSSADFSTWLVAGDYTAKPRNTHAFNVGMSFGSQSIAPLDSAPVAAAVVLSDRSRNAGQFHAFDRWRVSPLLLVDAGAGVSYFDYLAGDGVLVSPVAAVEVTPWGEGSALMLKAAISRREDAPGSAEFTPPAAGSHWLPPQRMFSPLPGETFRVERTDHVEVGLEHAFAETTIGVRRFAQRTTNQSAALFGLDRPGLPNESTHYFVAALGDVAVDGWSVKLATPPGQPLNCSIEYAIAAVEWTPFADVSSLVTPVRDGVDRVHDVTTTLGADLPQTKTRMLVIYRLSSSYSTETASTPSYGSRFDMQLNQGLPLPPSAGQWEVLLSVRNVLRDQRFGMSMLDELLAVSTPTRVVGGVQIRF